MKNSVKVMAAAATLLLSACVMPKPVSHADTTTPTAEIGCVSTDGGESCDLMLEDTTDPIYYQSCDATNWLGPCIAPAKDDIPPYFLEEDGSVSLISSL